MRTYTELVPKFGNRQEWTLPHLLAVRRRTHAGKRFLSVPEEGFEATFEEIHDQATRVGRALRDRGAAHGDRVLIMAENGSAYVQTWFGASVAGLVELPINRQYVGAILEHQVSTATPTLAVVGPEYADRLAASPAARSVIRRFFVLGEEGERAEAMRILSKAGFEVEPFSALLEGAPSNALPTITPSTIGGILFTSGTTGPSKAPLMPQGQMHFFAESIASVTRMTEDDVHMTCTPMFHGNAQVNTIYPALLSGAQVVVRRHFSASNWLRWIRDDAVSVTTLIGVMMDFVWRQARTPDDADNRLRCVFAIPTVAKIEAAFRERFGIDAFVEGFGNTEVTAPVLSPYGEPRPPGAAGLVVADWFEVRVADPETGDERPPGSAGEFLVRPKYPNLVAAGYLGASKETTDAWRDLWWHTGDAVRRDEDGWVYFVDRLKDALRRRGENISSFEVEQPILQHPDVVECAVIGVSAGIDGGEDEVMAVIVPRDGSGLTPAEVWDWCDGRVPAFATPRYVRFVSELPRTPSEKVLKRALRAEGVNEDTADRTARVEQPRQVAASLETTS